MTTAPAARVKHLGNLSLLAAVGGLAIVGLLMHWGVAHGQFWLVILTGLEAATVGALADWFAVTAMFRRVPIPLLARHTDILVKSKDRIALAIEKMVADEFFSPRNVDRLLADMVASQKLIDYLQKEGRLADLLERVLGEVGPLLSSPPLSEFLADEFKGALKDRDVAALLGNWLPQAVAQGYQNRVYDVVLDVVHTALDRQEIRDLVEQWLAKAGQDYKDRSWWKTFTGWLAEKTGAVEYSELAESLLSKLNDMVVQAKSPTSETRGLLDERLLTFAARLRAGHAEYTKYVRTIAHALIEYDKMSLLIGSFLTRVRRRIQQQAPNPESELMRWLLGRTRQLLYDFSTDAGKRAKLDAWVREKLKEYLEPGRLGGIVRRHLAEMPVEQFRDLIESKVGDELQWIRLNGALIGGLVGVGIGVARVLL